MLEHDKKSQLELWSEGKLHTGKPEPGLFYVSDLAWERKRMLASGRSPKVTLRDMTTVSQLIYPRVQAGSGRAHRPLPHPGRAALCERVQGVFAQSALEHAVSGGAPPGSGSECLPRAP